MAAGTKRKEREFDPEIVGEETNINVVVRCRGRNQREVRENSAVVVNADGVKGQQIELSMGASALSNKTYNFDRVYSPAADQAMVFDDTVKPMLEQMLAGYNCTIFAYGQTGTGKTYTMSGDMTDTLGMLSDEAGIIPRVLQQLFQKLGADGSDNMVKCSFIELYNEELRDLLAVDETAKLKIYDDATKKGHATTLVQGMEEKHIKNAAEGIKVLQDGSLKRQVAATKCNDLSSRSHTIFTVTAYVKKTNEQGADDLVSAGKLNLVDLAGSENIQRSGAENKRAAEAGLINKSLLTLGRVINALVDRGAHIPYRESKLTRLLQDSLGGRTKTCIIATISPAKSNLEETISTLDYAFRAKNIRNKPQLNVLTKKMLLRDFSIEIEKLKSELIATRQRNGVYLSNEMYEEMVAQSESRRIVMEEQAARLETLENNLRNKVQELFALTTSFMGLKKEYESLKAQLDDTKGVLEQTEIVLSTLRITLDEEIRRRKAHQDTEEKLAEANSVLVSEIEKIIKDVNGLHAKDKRKSDLQALNRTAWCSQQAQVADVTSVVERRIREFEAEQLEQISGISQRMEAFVGEELQKLTSTQTFLEEHLTTFAESKKQLLEQKQRSKDGMDEVLEEIKEVRDSVKDSVSQSLQVISQAAEKIAADVVSEMTHFHSQLHASYNALGKDFKSIFEDLVRHISNQRSESDSLRRQLQAATNAIITQNGGISAHFQGVLEQERRAAAEERQKLLSQISGLITAQAEAQESRLLDKAAEMQKNMTEANTSLEDAMAQYGQGIDGWEVKEEELLDEVKKSRDQLKTRLKDDWTGIEARSNAIQNSAKIAHGETVRVVEAQMEDLDAHMDAMDDFVARARSESAAHHAAQTLSVKTLSNTIEQSFGSISAHFKTSFDRVKNLGDAMELDAGDLRDNVRPLGTQLCRPLADLRQSVGSSSLQEYRPTGETPQKTQYHYPTDIPRTELHDDTLVEEEQDGDEPENGSDLDHDHVHLDLEDTDNHSRSNNNNNNSNSNNNSNNIFSNSTIVFADPKSSPSDGARSPSKSSPIPAADKNPLGASLREVNPNVSASAAPPPISFDPQISITSTPGEKAGRPLKRAMRGARGGKKGLLSEGRENVPLSGLDSASRRKSPRLK